MLNIFHSAAEVPEAVPRNSIIHADCFDVFDKIETASVDCILCDLPYGTTACSWDAVLPFDKLWAAYKRIAKPRAPIILFGSQPFTSALVMSNPKMFRFEWIWNKMSGANFANVKNQPLKVHENVLVFSKEPIKEFYPQRVLRSASSLKRHPIGQNPMLNRMASPNGVVDIYGDTIKGLDASIFKHNDGTKHPISILTFAKREVGSVGGAGKNSPYKHPTRKPLGVLKELIKTYTTEGALILDNCLGSGSTFVACVQTNRDCIGIEKFPISAEGPQYFYSHCIPRIEEAIKEKSNPTPKKAKKPKQAPPPQNNNPQLGLF